MKLDVKDVVKLMGFILLTASMWYDLKTDFRVHVATTELRLKALEERDSKPNYKEPQKYAVLPNQIKIEDEQGN